VEQTRRPQAFVKIRPTSKNKVDFDQLSASSFDRQTESFLWYHRNNNALKCQQIFIELKAYFPHHLVTKLPQILGIFARHLRLNFPLHQPLPATSNAVENATVLSQKCDCYMPLWG
jgi:hypothetical protein